MTGGIYSAAQGTLREYFCFNGEILNLMKADAAYRD